jgi:hypothetical protein
MEGVRDLVGVFERVGVAVLGSNGGGVMLRVNVRVGVFVEVTGPGVLMPDGVLVATRGAALAIPAGINNPERETSTHTTEHIC